MKATLPIFLIMLCLSSCAKNNQPFYTKIDAKTYALYKTVDTFYNTSTILVTNCKDTITRFENFVTLVKKVDENETGYYLLDSWEKLESDSTILLYSPPFETPIDYHSTKGIWLYAKFVSEETRGGVFSETTDEGIKFKVDSMPLTANVIARPQAEGIYFYRHGALTRISTEQSYEKFEAYHKNGFYFIPNTGMLFKRYFIKDMK